MKDHWRKGIITSPCDACKNTMSIYVSPKEPVDLCSIHPSWRMPMVGLCALCRDKYHHGELNIDEWGDWQVARS